MRDEIEGGSGFGICAIKEGSETGVVTPSIYDMGTLVKIIDWNQLSNGLLGITVEAKQRFLVGQQNSDPDGLLRAEVEFLAEEMDEAIPEWASGLVDIYQQMSFHPELARRLPAIDNIGASGLGWGLSQVLPMPQDVRMDCLRTCSAVERLERIAAQVQALADQANL